jgi:hypothetical protein
MGHFSMRIFCLLAFASYVAVITGSCAKDVGSVSQPLPDDLIGDWQVKSVVVNMTTERTLHYQRDDRILLGRHIVVEARSIHSSLPESRRCSQPSALIWKSSFESVIEATMAAQGYPPRTATMRDYELPAKFDINAAVVSVLCSPGRFGPIPLEGSPPERTKSDGIVSIGTWMVLLPDNTLAVRWFDQSILLLRLTKDSLIQMR